jgi:hypothetical protein
LIYGHYSRGGFANLTADVAVLALTGRHERR